MKRLVALLLITGCILASDKDKNTEKDKDKGKSGYDCGRHLERRGFTPSESRWLCDHSKSGNSGNNSSSSNDRNRGEKRN